MNLKRAIVALGCAVLSFSASISANAAANPAGLAFSNSTNASKYGKSTGIIIAGRCNMYDTTFANARKAGAEVLVYLDPVERPDKRVCALDQKFYMNNYGAVPLWPYPSYGQRIIWPNMRMTDMRPGSAWILHVVKYIEGLMREKKVDGVYLDVVGARPWGVNVAWETWSQSEKNAWTDGNIDLVRRLMASRKAINPKFIIVNNNVWDRGDTRGLAGEQYVDGVTIEHPKLGVPSWHRSYVGRKFAGSTHRRVIVIARNTTDARAWANVAGVTHVSDQMSYGTVSTPPVAFRDLNDR